MAGQSGHQLRRDGQILSWTDLQTQTEVNSLTLEAVKLEDVLSAPTCLNFPHEHA